LDNEAEINISVEYWKFEFERGFNYFWARLCAAITHEFFFFHAQEAFTLELLKRCKSFTLATEHYRKALTEKNQVG
jgi:hypothetical protein